MGAIFHFSTTDTTFLPKAVVPVMRIFADVDVLSLGMRGEFFLVSLTWKSSFIYAFFLNGTGSGGGITRNYTAELDVFDWLSILFLDRSIRLGVHRKSARRSIGETCKRRKRMSCIFMFASFFAVIVCFV